MDFIRILLSRCKALFGRRRQDADLDEELRSHIELAIEENLKLGMTTQHARTAALRDFGGVAQARESYRTRRGMPWAETLAQDVRYGLRQLRKVTPAGAADRSHHSPRWALEPTRPSSRWCREYCCDHCRWPILRGSTALATGWIAAISTAFKTMTVISISFLTIFIAISRRQHRSSSSLPPWKQRATASACVTEPRRPGQCVLNMFPVTTSRCWAWALMRGGLCLRATTGRARRRCWC